MRTLWPLRLAVKIRAVSSFMGAVGKRLLGSLNCDDERFLSVIGSTKLSESITKYQRLVSAMERV